MKRPYYGCHRDPVEEREKELALSLVALSILSQRCAKQMAKIARLKEKREKGEH